MKKLIAVILIVMMSVPMGLTAYAASLTPDSVIPDSSFTGDYKESAHEDGSITRMYKDGSVGTRYPDGSFEGVDANGNRHTEDKDGTYSVYGTDGSIATEQPDGTRTLTEQNGRKTVLNPDGSGKTVYGSGVVIEHNADFEQTAVYFEGGKDRMEVDENGNFHLGEITGKNGEVLTNSEDGLHLKGANGVEYTLSDSNGSASIRMPDGGHIKVENGTGEIRFADGSVFTGMGEESGKYTAPNGSYVYLDNNSAAWEMYDENDGTHVKFDEDGDLKEFYQNNDKMQVEIRGGKIVEWRDIEAGITIRSDENGTTVETPDGTYFTDGRGNVTKDGEPIRTQEENSGTSELPDEYDDTYFERYIDNKEMWMSHWNSGSEYGYKVDPENGVYYYDWVRQIWDVDHTQLFMQERYDMTVHMNQIQAQQGESMDYAYYTIKVDDYSYCHLSTQYQSLDEIDTPSECSRMNIKVAGYDAVYIYQEYRDEGDGYGILPYTYNKGTVYVQIDDAPNCYGNPNMLRIQGDMSGYNFDIFDSMLPEYLALIKNLPCTIDLKSEAEEFAPMPAEEEPFEEDSDKDSDDESEYTPYSGRLTYTNGNTNKYGQPWPDLMDFDGDGDIDYADRQLQHILVHNPNALDTPQGAMLVLVALLAALLGAGAGTASSIVSAGLGSAGAGLNLQFEFSEEEDETSAGEGAAAEEPEMPEKQSDLGPYIQRDADGDLNVTDPATGENRLYTANGDGTYTNPLTGATYTEQELKDSLESRAENAGLIRQDKAAADEAIRSQREDNQDKSWIAKEAEAAEAARIAQENRDADYNRYKAQLADKYGVYSGDDDVYAKIGEKQGEAEVEGYEQFEYEKEYQKSQKYAENMKKGADVAIDIYAEVDPTGGGKKFKDGYTVATAAASNAGDAMAGYKSLGGAIVQTAVDSGVGLLKNHSNGATEKFASNIMGDSIQAMSDTYMKGGSVEDIRNAGESAAIQGGINAAVDVAFDAFGGKANEKLGLTGNKVVGSVLGKDVTKDMTGKATGVIANTVTKEALTIPDKDEKSLENLRKEQDQAEAQANADAAERFREAQKEWAERRKEAQNQSDTSE